MSTISQATFQYEAVPTKDAATVMLVRDGDTGIEVFLLRRVKGMPFAGGATVFPGGGVDATDAAATVTWAGPPDTWWAGRLGTDPETARALVLAAVRETFEECGVLLAGPTTESVVADTTRFTQARQALESRHITFGRFLEDEGLVVRTDLLRPWAHWITPVGEPRRYDTRFFIAVAPEGQSADGATTEADEVVWQTPSAAIGQWCAGESMLMPPTWSQLTELSKYRSVAEVLEATPDIPVILPEIVMDGERVRVGFPGQDGYYRSGGPLPF
ncbi:MULTISPECIES: NUDIX domain-containing protein [unclassified Rhodococcus (in: high G+C Gram-positive bacteria)]|uniref:NUDIX hydrolase n=1 Tax=unclassified Rhodococcus (in: high G+C Gram-positive bacteria) TaxID=192944 RepID=UPI00163AEED6|nr:MULTISPECIES: NUDIX domain-containing protein [unclassified Rhodococcus (in: high G+C Gram-positive bacteria)]MBC2642063.1 NUDIX domain-containing protein [Rhodococcus sp. 3A]MBC2893195.1 NUDIX domain-containing protein [Rhodococcus sp. 4CII]